MLEGNTNGPFHLDVASLVAFSQAIQMAAVHWLSADAGQYGSGHGASVPDHAVNG